MGTETKRNEWNARLDELEALYHSGEPEKMAAAWSGLCDAMLELVDRKHVQAAQPAADNCEHGGVRSGASNLGVAS